MTRPQTAKGRATRQRLLDAASEQLVADGTIEVARIAAAVGVAPSVLYRYFDGRDGLVAAVVEDFYDRYEERVFARRDVPGQSWAIREAWRLAREIAFFYEHPLGPTLASGLTREAAAAAVDAERTRAHGAAAGRNIRAGQSDGELSSEVDAGLAGAAIIGAVRAMLSEALARTPPAPQDEVARIAVRIGVALLGDAQDPIPSAVPPVIARSGDA